MSAPKHTPGPYSAHSLGSSFCIVGPKQNGHQNILALLPENPRIPIKANAERIVVCVNACEGLADPSVVPELLAELKGALRILEASPATRTGCASHVSAIREVIARAEDRS